MNDRNTAGISTGSVSILAIFVVLCLTTLATLSLVSARADLVLSDKMMQADQEYYVADAKAEEELGDMMGLLDSGGLAAVGQDARFTVAQQEGAATVQYTVPINEIKTIYVEVTVDLDAAGAPTGEWARTMWQTRVDDSAEAQPEPTMNVLK